MPDESEAVGLLALMLFTDAAGPPGWTPMARWLYRPDAVVAMNRAVAIGELHGPAEGLAALETIDARRLDTYQPFHAARADLLGRAGRVEEAVAAYERAIELTTNLAGRRFLARQRASVALRAAFPRAATGGP